MGLTEVLLSGISGEMLSNQRATNFDSQVRLLLQVSSRDHYSSK